MSKDCYSSIEPNPIVVPGKKRGKNFYGYQMFDSVLTNWWIRLRYDYLIYVDEDCFISDVDELYKLVKYFIENEYDFCGVPDGGVIAHRHHNPISINTFFTIFNLKSIKQVYNHKGVEKTVYTPELDKFIPHSLLKADLPDPLSAQREEIGDKRPESSNITYDDFEPYYKIFFWLLLRGAKPLYLDARNSALDGGLTTEVVNHLGKVFCYHTWYAREYSSDDDNKCRINSVYEFVKKL